MNALSVVSRREYDHLPQKVRDQAGYIVQRITQCNDRIDESKAMTEEAQNLQRNFLEFDGPYAKRQIVLMNKAKLISDEAIRDLADIQQESIALTCASAKHASDMHKALSYLCVNGIKGVDGRIIELSCSTEDAINTIIDSAENFVRDNEQREAKIGELQNINKRNSEENERKARDIQKLKDDVSIIYELKKSIPDIYGNIDVLEKKHFELSKAFSEASETFRRENAQQESKITDLQKHNRKNSESISALKEENERKAKDIQKLQDKVSDISKIKKSISDGNKSIDNLSEQYSELSKSFEIQQEAVKQFEIDLSSQAEKITVVVGQLEDEQKVKDEINEQLKEELKNQVYDIKNGFHKKIIFAYIVGGAGGLAGMISLLFQLFIK